MFPTALPTRKRRRPEVAFVGGREEVKFRDVTLFLVERRMGKSRRNFLSNLARSKGFCVDDALRYVTKNTTQWIRRSQTLTCAEDNNPVVEQRSCAHPSATPESAVSQYACQRRTTLDNHNKIFTGGSFEVRGSSLPRAVLLITDCLGKSTVSLMRHTASIFQSSGLVIFHRCLQALIYDLLIYKQHAGFKQLCRSSSGDFQSGFLFYEDISKPVSRTEASALKILVEEAVICVNPSATVSITGGFSSVRCFGFASDGSPSEEWNGAGVWSIGVAGLKKGGEEDIILAVIERFKSQNILLYSDFQESTFDLRQLPTHCFEAMDHFSKCFLIIKLKREQETDARAGRDWRAVRVDLVAPPLERFAYALLGWTGSTLFGRDLRRFARLERGKLLDNHVLYDKATNTFLPANTEEDIFAHLGLEYIEPWQRNA
ncbi:DNA nucleotidylexotransferase-like [Cyprinus carpio]|uniref:DNA nucleotidylexotransferase-like n=1 Tax=Cyprinus carpio TaxID=7962 RepID=A0A9Q9X004_CYPCA|nr:DNA nucleotidylexotransferase-like [Cyprinus carpio]